jgi:non-specific serine/threonine protein kinase
MGLAFAGALWGFWEARGHLVEGRHHLNAVLAGDSAKRRTWARGKALNAAGHLACIAGDFGQALAALDEAIGLWRELADARGLARALATQGFVLYSQREYAAARFAWEEALEVGRNAADDVRVAGVLTFLAMSAQQEGNLERASRLLTESLALRRKLDDDWGVASCLSDLASIALAQAETDRAEMLYRESLELCSNLADQRAVVDAVEALAWVAGIRGQTERAARLFGAAAAHRARLGIAIRARDRDAHEQGVIRVRESIAAPAFARLWAEGEAMSLQEAIMYALAHSETTAGGAVTPA